MLTGSIVLLTTTVNGKIKTVKVYCLSCPNEWTPRGASVSRQCPSCWSRVLATEDELRLGALVCHLLANFSATKLPPPPSLDPLQALGDVIGFPFSIKTYHDVMGRARDQSERRRAATLMLRQRGLNEAEVQDLAQIMFP